MIKTKENIKIAKIERGILKLTVIGDTPYMPEPMDMAVLERYDKKRSNKVYDKDNVSEDEKVKEKYYYTTDGKKGIPARAFYKAMIKATSYLIEKSSGGMRNTKEGVLVHGDILPLIYEKEELVEHWGKTSGTKGSPRKILRNAFHNWKVKLTIEYNKSHLSAEQIINILNWAGFYIGVGAFRKENTGYYGLFHVEV